MKKIEIFLLFLLAGLPGCCRKQCEPICCDAPAQESAEQYNQNDVADFDDDYEDDEESVRSFFNEETGEFEADLEEWVFADDLDFPMPMMAENNEAESITETVEVAVSDFDTSSESEKKKAVVTVNL